MDVRVKFANGAEAVCRPGALGLEWHCPENTDVQEELNRWQEAYGTPGGWSHVPEWTAAEAAAEEFGGTILTDPPTPPKQDASRVY